MARGSRNGAETLEAYGSEQYADDLGIDILDGDIELQRTTIAGSGYGTAFSGGKDSLLQAAMLFEFTERPLSWSRRPPRFRHFPITRHDGDDMFSMRSRHAATLSSSKCIVISVAPGTMDLHGLAIGYP